MAQNGAGVTSPLQQHHGHVDDPARDELWDQRRTLRPPPYEGRLKKYLAGVHMGDEPFDGFSKRELIGLAHGGALSV
jgi:hypothetical protein